MVQISIEYQGGLRCEAVHGPSKNKFFTDAPVDNHGKGESFSPTDLVATALGTCMLTTMGIAADRMKIDLAGSRATVQKEMVRSPLRRIGKLTVEIDVPNLLSEADRESLERAAMTCTVHRSMHP